MECFRTRRFRELLHLGLSNAEAQRQVASETSRSVLRAYRDGALLKDIAQHLGVSVTRAGQLRNKAIRLEDRAKQGWEKTEPLLEACNERLARMDLRRLARL